MPLPVGDGEVRGRARGSSRSPRPGRAAGPPSNGYGSPGATGLVAARSVIRRAARGGELLREQAAQRDVEEVRVGEVGVAVGERVAGRLEEVGAAPPRAVMPAEVVALEDVERLADGRAAARRRPHPVDVEPAVGHVGRRALAAPCSARRSRWSSRPAATRGSASGATGGCVTVSTIACGELRPGRSPCAPSCGDAARRCAPGRGCGRRCRRRAACRPGRGRARPSPGGRRSSRGSPGSGRRRPGR